MKFIRAYRVSGVFALFLALALPPQPARADCSPPPPSPFGAPLSELQSFIDISGGCEVPPSEGDLALLTDALRPYVKALKRSVSFYHWGSRGGLDRLSDGRYPRNTRPGIDEIINLPSLSVDGSFDNIYRGPVALRPIREEPDGSLVDVAAEYFKGLSRGFFHTEGFQQAWFVGNGLYGAMDPNISSGYIGKPGFLLEISIPPGVRYLDLREKGDSPILPLSGAALNAAKRIYVRGSSCQTPIGEELYRRSSATAFTLPKMLADDYPRASMEIIFKRLGIQFVAASWQRPSYEVCARNQGRKFTWAFPGTDVVFSDPGLSSQLGLRIFVQELETSASVEKAQAYNEMSALLKTADYPKSEARQIASSWDKSLGERQGPPLPVPHPDPAQFFTCSADPLLRSEIELPGGRRPAPETLEATTKTKVMKVGVQRRKK